MTREFADDVLKIRITNGNPDTNAKLNFDQKDYPYFTVTVFGQRYLLPIRMKTDCLRCGNKSFQPLVMAKCYYDTETMFEDIYRLGEYASFVVGAKSTLVNSSYVLEKSQRHSGKDSVFHGGELTVTEEKLHDVIALYSSYRSSPILITKANLAYITANSNRMSGIEEKDIVHDKRCLNVMEKAYGVSLTVLPRALFYCYQDRFNSFTEGWFYANIHFAATLMLKRDETPTMERQFIQLCKDDIQHASTIICMSISLFVSRFVYKFDGFSYVDVEGMNHMLQFEWFTPNAITLVSGDCEDFAITIFSMLTQLRDLKFENDLVVAASTVMKHFIVCNTLLKTKQPCLRFDPDAKKKTTTDAENDELFDSFHMTTMLVPCKAFQGAVEAGVLRVKENTKFETRREMIVDDNLHPVFVEGTISLYPDVFESNCFDEQDINLAGQIVKEKKDLLLAGTGNNFKGASEMFGPVLQIMTDIFIDETNFTDKNNLFTTIFDVEKIEDEEQIELVVPLTHFFEQKDLSAIRFVPHLSIRGIYADTYNVENILREYINRTLDVDITEYKKQMQSYELMKWNVATMYSVRNDETQAGGIPYLPYNMCMDETFSFYNET
jgi:hypothetical protein